VFLGSNPANDQPVTMKYLDKARRGGTRVLSVNAYREPGMERYWVPSSTASALFGTRITDRTWLVRVGGDLAFLNAVQRVLLEKGWVAQEFIEQATEGLDELRAVLEAQPMERLLEIAGLSLTEVEDFARELHQAERAVFVWSMGITQHVQGADTVRAICNLGLLREYVGRPGTGMMPIRGHSGVQGGAEMGAYSTAFPGGVAIDAESARRFSDLWGFEVPHERGRTTVEYLAAAEAGELDALYAIGGNFLETMPEPARIEQALSTIPLRIHSDIVLTSQMLVDPAEVVFVLPARTRYEQEGGGTETSTERRVIFSPEIPGHPVGEARTEWRTNVYFPTSELSILFKNSKIIQLDGSWKWFPLKLMKNH
jgi:predicted molibdopterin-dependent oxidoreductase YjgC